MKKIITLMFVLFIGFAVVAGSVAAPGRVMASVGNAQSIDEFDYRLYVPMIVKPGMVSPTLPLTCIPESSNDDFDYKVINYNTSVGYEDLDLSSPYMDFDYNDWITDIKTDLCYYYVPDVGSFLWQLDFAVVPQARGASLDHAYHIDFPANIFLSDGVATLTKYDAAGNVIGTPLEQPFLADQINQYDMVDPTSNALPGSIVNTLENRPYQQVQGFATLTIRFNDPFWFDFSLYDPAQPDNAHGEKLFFQPHLFVYQNPTYEIGPGNPLMLVVPFLTWEWPEERVNIWRAYPDVTPGDTSVNPKVPPEFPGSWYNNFNDCVYNGVPCSAPAPSASVPALAPYPAP